MTLRDLLYPPRKTDLAVVRSPRVKETVTFAVVSDLHNAPCDDAMDTILACDAVLAPGDLLNRHREGCGQALAFVHEVLKKIPVFISLGNHELRSRDRESFLRALAATDAAVLDGGTASFRGTVLGGVTRLPADPATLDALERADGFRILLCHHPEWFSRCAQERDIDLTVSGHAHGGQMRLFGRGLYAPGQGFLPKLTDGFYFADKLLVSTGMTNSAELPRIGNPCRLIILRLEPGTAERREIRPFTP